MRAPGQVLSTTAKVELVLALVFTALFLRFQDDVAAWLTPRMLPVQMSALGPCREPSEHEVLLIAYVKRDGEVLRDGCTYAGSQSAHPNNPRPKVADATAHD